MRAKTSERVGMSLNKSIKEEEEAEGEERNQEKEISKGEELGGGCWDTGSG